MVDARSIIVDPETGELEATLNQPKEPAGEPEAPVNEAAAKQETPAQPAASEEDELPEKYRGKSIAEVVAMHQNAERALGEKNNELGRWRQLATDRSALENQRALTNAREDDDEEDVELTSDALFDNADEAITRKVRALLREELGPVRETVERTAATSRESEFQANHPNAEEVASSPEFQAWVRRSPYRVAEAAAAGQGDLDAAERLLDEFTADNPAPANPAPTADPAPAPQQTQNEEALAAARAAATETGGNSAPVQNKPTYTADEITQMIATDFAKYSSPAFQAELQEAIREGRVSGL